MTMAISEGPRRKKLNLAFEKAVGSVKAKCCFDQVSSVFPPILCETETFTESGEPTSILSLAYENSMNHFSDKLAKHWTDLCQDTGILEKLDLLDHALLADGISFDLFDTKSTWSPDAIVKKEEMPNRQAVIDLIDREIDEINGKNADLIEEINEKRLEMQQWKHEWKSIEKDWNDVFVHIQDQGSDVSLKQLAKDLANTSNPLSTIF